MNRTDIQLINEAYTGKPIDRFENLLKERIARIVDEMKTDPERYEIVHKELTWLLNSLYGIKRGI